MFCDCFRKLTDVLLLHCDIEEECNIVLVEQKAPRSMESSQQSWKWEAVTSVRPAELGVKWGNSSC